MSRTINNSKCVFSYIPVLKQLNRRLAYNHINPVFIEVTIEIDTKINILKLRYTKFISNDIELINNDSYCWFDAILRFFNQWLSLKSPVSAL